MASNHTFEADLLCYEETRGLGSYDDDDKTNERNEIEYGDKEGLSDLPCLSEESIAWMLEKENDHLPRDDYLHRLCSGGLDASLRREAISWMFKAWAYNSFTELVLYTALNFFDRFLSMYQLPEEKPHMIHLAAVVCLWIAAKLEETIVPSTEKLQESQPGNVYDVETMKDMEIKVLKCLKWNMRSYTPCNFLDYFLRKMNQGKIPLGYISRSFEYITATFKGTTYLQFRSSEIAAAVSLYVSREMHAVDIEQAVSTCIQMDKSRVLKCVEIIQDLSKGDELTDGSRRPSSSSGHNNPESKRRKFYYG